MTQRTMLLAGIILLLGSYGFTRVGVVTDPSSPPASFAIATIHIEQNATDGDFEIVLEAMAGDEGLVKLTVVAPDGRTIVDFTGTQTSSLGMREFRFESPEPKNFNSLKSAYPEGVYTFSGSTASGVKLEGKATLSHKLPLATPTLLQPKPGAKSVEIKNLQINWTPVKNAAAYMLYIDQDKLDVSLTVRLLGSADSFAVPDGFLLPGTEYTLGVGAVMNSGNTSFVETSFRTAGQ
jgi:hypothetical protein